MITPRPMTFRPIQALMASILAVFSYHIAFRFPDWGFMILPALIGFCWLKTLPSNRYAFYGGLILGVAIAGPQHFFFYRIFGPAAFLLWIIIGFWLGVFLLILRNMHRLLKPALAVLLTPFAWIGIEYFRCELYYLRFTWITPGEAFWSAPGLARVGFIGFYGISFIAITIASFIASARPRFVIAGLALLLIFSLSIYIPYRSATLPENFITVAGVQTEDKNSAAIVGYLEKIAIEHPDAQLWVLCEYAFMDEVPKNVRDVVKKHGKYLIAGGKEKLPDGKFYNTAFVIDPNGEVVFKQVKSVPVQFMDDGIPAKTRDVWDSPWGKIGICICYDLCYRRVMDDFVDQGAQAIIIPTMDVENWGLYERTNLHGPFQTLRSAEYGVSTFGVWSSGVSLLTNPDGKVIASSGYPAIGQPIYGKLYLKPPANPPIDSTLAMLASIGVGFLSMLLYALNWQSRRCISLPLPAAEYKPALA